VPGWYLVEGFKPNASAKVIEYALRGGTEAELLAILQKPDGIADLAKLAAKGYGSPELAIGLAREIVRDCQRRATK